METGAIGGFSEQCTFSAVIPRDLLKNVLCGPPLKATAARDFDNWIFEALSMLWGKL